MIRNVRLLQIAILIVLLAAGSVIADDTSVRTTTLPNGLDVVMMPDATSPLLSSLLIVRAGSGNETLATAGATHLLEHMMFRGTETRSQDQIYDTLDRMGAYYNAQTSKTYTNFILVTPVEHAHGAMDIQADMVLNSTIDPDTLEIEKGRVIAEIEQGREHAASNAEVYYRRDVYEPTSYAFPTTGFVPGVKSLSADDIKGFHDNWYVPNNMTLVLRGDLSFDEMESLAQAVYGSYTASTLPDRPEAWPAGFDDWRRNRVFKHYGAERSGSIQMAVAAPRYDEALAPAFSAMSLLLDDRLEQQLKQGKPLVTYVYSSVHNDSKFSILEINAGLMPDTDPDVVAERMVTALQSLSPEMVDMTELKNALNEQQRFELFFSEQVQYGSFLLVPKLAVAPWGFWQEYEEQQANITERDVADAYRLWFEYPTWIASAYLPEQETEQTGGVTMGPIVADTLENGAIVTARDIRGAPVAGIHLAVRGRSAIEGDDHRGWVDLLHRLLLEGNEEVSSDSLERRMNEIGMEMQVVDDPRVPMDNYRTVPEYSFVRIQVVAQNWDEALRFLAERLSDAGFTDEQFETVKAEAKDVWGRGKAGLSDDVNSRFNDLLYGDHIKAVSIYGDDASLEAATPEAVRDFRDMFFAAPNLVISVLAPAPVSQIMDVADQAFTSLPGGEVEMPGVSEPEMTAAVDTVRASGRQGYLATGFLFRPFPPEDHAAALVANMIVSTRIYRDLGEKRGWAYGAGSSLTMRDEWGAWTCKISLPEEHLEEGRIAAYEHLTATADGDIDEDRFEIAKNDMRGSMLRRYSSRINLAMAMGADAIVYGDPDRTWVLYNQLEKLTLDDVKRAAAKYLSPPDEVVTIYGVPEGESERPHMPMGGMGGH